MDNSYYTITKYLNKKKFIYSLLLMIFLSLVSCKVSKTRMMFINCSGTTLLTDSKEGYYNAQLRIHYLSKNTPAKR
jgi:hypothetical protein